MRSILTDLWSAERTLIGSQRHGTHHPGELSKVLVLVPWPFYGLAVYVYKQPLRFSIPACQSLFLELLADSPPFLSQPAFVSERHTELVPLRTQLSGISTSLGDAATKLSNVSKLCGEQVARWKYRVHMNAHSTSHEINIH